MNQKPFSPPSAKRVHVLVDYSSVALATDQTEGYVAGSDAKYYSDVTIREFYTKEQLEQHKVSSQSIIDAENARDSQVVIGTANEEIEWVGNVV